VLKIKVGLHDPATELAQLAALAQVLPPDVKLRLDANGAWEFAAAQQMVDGLAQLPIESLEEPLRQPEPAQFAALQQRVNFPLARDESLQIPPFSSIPPDPPFSKGGGEGGLFSLAGNWEVPFALEEMGVRRLVLKPAAIGGMRRTLALAQRAQAAGMEVVLTSVIDSAAGLWATAQLAAACASPIPHGLATAEWLATDLGIAPQPQRGQLILPLTPGSGFSPTTV
jgi:L-alanine-DL-glutamate epimerase-like enolase superfamily enzyme